MQYSGSWITPKPLLRLASIGALGSTWTNRFNIRPNDLFQEGEPAEIRQPVPPRSVEGSSSEWATVKRLLAARVDPVAYANWIEATCQVGRSDTTVRVWLPDALTREWLESECAAEIGGAVAGIGGLALEYTYDCNAHESCEIGVKAQPRDLAVA